MGKTSVCFINRISYLSTVFFRISSIIPALFKKTPTSYWSLFSTFGNMFNSHTLESQQDGAKVWQLDMCEHVETGWCFRFLCEHWMEPYLSSCAFCQIYHVTTCRYARLASGSAVFLFKPSRRPNSRAQCYVDHMLHQKFRCSLG